MGVGGGVVEVPGKDSSDKQCGSGANWPVVEGTLKIQERISAPLSED